MVLSQFSNIVFAFCCAYRNQLLGRKDAESGEYSTDTGELFSHGISGPAVNFRTLLLLCFKPHGGRDADTIGNDQQVVYVEISRDSSADALTVRSFLLLIQEHVRPVEPGRPHYVVVSGDQPSYKCFFEMWLESWRKENGWKGRKDHSTADSKLMLHHWLIPFPGFFHAEKQAIYSVCKEMLDGLGLEELAACAGLSESHVRGILSHTHARNNRSVLFNLAGAMIIHLSDMLVSQKRLQRFTRKVAERGLEPILICHSRRAAVAMGQGKELDLARAYCMKKPQICDQLELVTDDMIRVGQKMEQVEKTYVFVSRTGHTDLTEAFWFHYNRIFHSTNHLRYQELSIFYGFIIPEVFIEELHTKKPGRSVMRLFSFTSKFRNAMGKWGWAYVHMGEALEMLIVRHLKSLSVNFLGHLENSVVWLFEVSMFRAFCRYMTCSSRSLSRRRIQDDEGELPGPLGLFDRNACQWRIVSRMVHVMRESGFFNTQHRSSEWLCNMFSTTPVRMNNRRDQDLILEVSERGKTTSKLQVSVLFPELFGPLTDADKQKYFPGFKFNKWTRSRTVLRPAQSISKLNG